MSATAASNSRRPADFQTTRWTRICLAKSDSPEGRLALGELCAADYEPVVACLHSTLRDPDAARETAHAFFAQVLAGGKITHAEEARGRFRHYLLGAVKHFIAHQRESASRLRRGAGATHDSLDAEDAPELAATDHSSPALEFDRQWAITVVHRAMEALQLECVLAGKSLLFEKVEPVIHGDADPGYLAKTAAEIEMTEGALRVALHRLRQQFRQCVKAEIAQTLHDPAAIEDEMQSLFIALGG